MYSRVVVWYVGGGGVKLAFVCTRRSLKLVYLVLAVTGGLGKMVAREGSFWMKGHESLIILATWLVRGWLGSTKGMTQSRCMFLSVYFRRSFLLCSSALWNCLSIIFSGYLRAMKTVFRYLSSVISLWLSDMMVQSRSACVYITIPLV